MDLIMFRCYCNKCNIFYTDDLALDDLCPYCEGDDTEVMDDDLDEDDDIELTWEEFMAQKITETETLLIGAQ